MVRRLARDQSIAPALATALAGSLGEAVRTASDFAASAVSDATKAIYERDWQHFAAWCREQGINAGDLPIHPVVIAAYIGSQAGSLGRSALNVRVAAIAYEHCRRGHTWTARHPAIRDTLAGISRSRKEKVRPAAALCSDEVKQLLSARPEDLAGLRDHAMFLMALAPPRRLRWAARRPARSGAAEENRSAAHVAGGHGGTVRSSDGALRRAGAARASGRLAGDGGAAGAAALPALLPRRPREQQAAEREIRDTRRQLDELRTVRAAAAWLDARPQLGRDVFGRPAGVNPRVSSYMDLMGGLSRCAAARGGPSTVGRYTKYSPGRYTRSLPGLSNFVGASSRWSFSCCQ